MADSSLSRRRRYIPRTGASGDSGNPLVTGGIFAPIREGGKAAIAPRLGIRGRNGGRSERRYALICSSIARNRAAIRPRCAPSPCDSRAETLLPPCDAKEIAI